MNIIKKWEGKNCLKLCEKECKEKIIVDSKENIDYIELVEIPYNLNAIFVYYKEAKDKVA